MSAIDPNQQTANTWVDSRKCFLCFTHTPKPLRSSLCLTVGLGDTLDLVLLLDGVAAQAMGSR